jgi:hypothetical protein
MTISSQTRKAGPFIGSGSTGPFAFTFKVFQASDLLVVTVNTTTLVETTLTLTTNYTVSLNSDQNTSPGGSITLVSPLATGNNMVISSQVPYLQETDLTNQGGFYPEVITDALDKLTVQAQQLKLDADRSAKLPITSEADADSLVADIVRIADSADNIDIVANNIADVNTVAGNIDDVTVVSGIADDVVVVSGISSNVTSVADNEANINIVYGNIDSVVSVASNIADVVIVADNDANITVVAGIDSEITTVSGIAADVTTTASNDANITNVATNIANVNTVAGISADVTTVATNVADVTNFADVYLGPSATDPATRNDSSALQAGDLYFNTVDDAMKVYTGSAWTVAYVPDDVFLVAANNLSDVISAATARQNLDLEIGVDVQAYDADTAKTDVAQSFTAQQTFAELKETVFTLGTTGTIALDPANGSIQSSTLTGDPTFTDSLEAGQTIVLMLNGGASYTVTWPTVTWVTSAGDTAPTLTANDTLVFWKVSTTLYGAYVGSYA